MNRSDETALPPDGPANMPSHILKATEYAKVFSEGIDDILFVCGWLGDFVQRWFEKLIEKKTLSRRHGNTWMTRKSQYIA